MRKLVAAGELLVGLVVCTAFAYAVAGTEVRELLGTVGQIPAGLFTLAGAAGLIAAPWLLVGLVLKALGRG